MSSLAPMKTSGEVPERLHEAGFFTFEASAIRLIDSHFAQLHPVESPEALVQSREITYLDAAEFALLPKIMRPKVRRLPPEGPRLKVSTYFARLAILKAGCTPIDGCLRYFGPHTPDDFTVFSGDSIKLANFGFEQARPKQPAELWRAVDWLEETYRSSPSILVESASRSGILRMQGLLWHLKISLMAEGFQYGSQDAAMSDARAYFMSHEKLQ